MIKVIAIINIILLVAIIYQAHEHNQELLRRERDLRTWLFKSLYSINHKVLLPDEAERPIKREKATVYSPEDDPMKEFTSGLDDYFGDKND